MRGVRCFRVGSSYRISRQCGAGLDNLLGLVPATSGSGAPRVVALQMHPAGSPRIDPDLVVEQVIKTLDEHEAATGVRIHLEAVEYVPSDHPRYSTYYLLARELLLCIARGE